MALIDEIMRQLQLIDDTILSDSSYGNLHYIEHCNIIYELCISNFIVNLITKALELLVLEIGLK